MDGAIAPRGHPARMNPELQDQLAIAALAQTWALARDSGDWEKLRATAHPDATMTTTWFDGGFDDFIESCQASWSKGSRSQHFLGGTVAEINGARAIAQTRMAIMVRSALDGVEVDAACYGRFFDRVEKRDGAWRIAKSGGLPPSRLPADQERRRGQPEPADRARRGARKTAAGGAGVARRGTIIAPTHFRRPNRE